MKQFISEFNFDPRDPPHAAVMLIDGEEDSDMIITNFKSEWAKDLLSRADSSIPETDDIPSR